MSSTRIKSGAQVTLSYSIYGISEKRLELQKKNIITVIAGGENIIKTIDSKLIGMQVGENVEVIVQIDDISPDFMDISNFISLGQNQVVFLICIISFINVPRTQEEIISYIIECAVKKTDLSVHQVINKGAFKIQKTYDAIEAWSIGQEFYILNSLSTTKKHILQRSKFPTSTSTKIWPNIDSNYLHEYSIFNIVSAPSPMHCARILPIGINTQYIIPIWPKSQPRISFLPTLLRVTVTTKCDLIVLFDHDDDWNENSKYKDNIDLRVGDVALDLVLEAECKDASGMSTLSWLITNDGTNPHKTVTESRLDDSTSGYRCGLLRCAGWQRGGSIPQKTIWDGFWTLYRSASKEITRRSKDDKTDNRVLVVDCGAIINNGEVNDGVVDVDVDERAVGVGGVDEEYWGLGDRAASDSSTLDSYKCVQQENTSECATTVTVTVPVNRLETIVDNEETSTEEEEKEENSSHSHSNDVIMSSSSGGMTAENMTSSINNIGFDDNATVDNSNHLTMTMTMNDTNEQLHTKYHDYDTNEKNEEADGEDTCNTNNNCNDEIDDDDDDDGQEDEEESEKDREDRLKSVNSLRMFAGMMLGDTTGYTNTTTTTGSTAVTEVEADEEMTTATTRRKEEAEYVANRRYFTLKAAELTKEMSHELKRLQSKQSLQRRLQQRRSVANNHDVSSVSLSPSSSSSSSSSSPTSPPLPPLELQQLQHKMTTVTGHEQHDDLLDRMEEVFNVGSGQKPVVVQSISDATPPFAAPSSSTPPVMMSLFIAPPLPPVNSIVVTVVPIEISKKESLHDDGFEYKSFDSIQLQSLLQDSYMNESSNDMLNIARCLWEVVSCSPALCLTQTQYKAVYKTLCLVLRNEMIMESSRTNH
eukprot:gene6857-13892_t